MCSLAIGFGLYAALTSIAIKNDAFAHVSRWMTFVVARISQSSDTTRDEIIPHGGASVLVCSTVRDTEAPCQARLRGPANRAL
jgi:hypothetical protein